jgi:hypothetical protein
MAGPRSGATAKVSLSAPSRATTISSIPSSGLPATVITAPPTTYSEFTLGVTYKPPLPTPIATLLLRPEIRYDRSLNGTHPFNAGRDSGAVTIAADAILGF